MDQAIANENEIISANTIVQMLGLADRGYVFDLMEAIFKGEANTSLNIFNKDAIIDLTPSTTLVTFLIISDEFLCLR